MKKLRVTASFTAVFGFLSVLALIFLFLALSDIAQQEEDLILEWRIAGICMIILSAFTVTTFITLGFLIRGDRIWEKKKNS